MKERAFFFNCEGREIEKPPKYECACLKHNNFVTQISRKPASLCSDFIALASWADSIKRNKLLDSLTQNKIPPKLIRLIKLTLENTTTKVKVNNAYTEEFRVKSGVKQSDPLSLTLFSLVIDTTFKNLIWGVTSPHDSDNLRPTQMTYW